MRDRTFRPTLSDRLEPRIVLDGKHAVVLTTNTYANARSRIDEALDRFIASGVNQVGLDAFRKELKVAAKMIPYGGQKLFPTLAITAQFYATDHQEGQLKPVLESQLKHYIELNIKGGAIKYVQSNVHYTTDADILTSGHVAKGSKK